MMVFFLIYNFIIHLETLFDPEYDSEITLFESEMMGRSIQKNQSSFTAENLNGQNELMDLLLKKYVTLFALLDFCLYPIFLSSS